MSIPPNHAVSEQEMELVWRDKYHGMSKELILDELEQDRARLASGEPLAYVIGWVPFLDLVIQLDSKPLIPRPETEWWTEKLITHLQEKYGNDSFTFLDLCAGSGVIGLAILKAFPNARVSFADISSDHAVQIIKNADVNAIPRDRLEIFISDLYSSFPTQRFDIIATNPPYIPTTRELPAEVITYEPQVALYAGTDGLDYIRTILLEAPDHLNKGTEKGCEMWMECDISNIEDAAKRMRLSGGVTTIHEDPYGRPRLIVGHFT